LQVKSRWFLYAGPVLWLVDTMADMPQSRSRILAAAALCGLATTAVAVQPIKVDGKDFVNSVTGDRFQIIGVE